MRRNGKYKEGETPRQYGIGMRLENGTLAFMTEGAFTMGWGSDYAATWSTPPTHYLDQSKGHFLINFNKETSPVTLANHHSRSNYVVFPRIQART